MSKEAAAAPGSSSSAGFTLGEKRPRLQDDVVVKGLFDGGLAPKAHQKSDADLEGMFASAVETHPFVDRSHYNAIVDADSVFRDANGNVVCVLLKNALPEKVSAMASDVLRAAPTRTSLRSTIFGGESPLSGIAGYYDYSGSPVELKCRKTSFTYEHIKTWAGVFPMISHVSELYKEACPDQWAKQNAAIPDAVRLRDSPFSTLTINQRFRTARHTDAGDFDDGMGVLAVLEGNFEGLHLGMPDFGVCFRMQPRDVLLFNTHHFHCNTELELPFKNSEWDRLTCVFYYRSQLGESNCVSNYRRRLADAMDAGNHDVKITTIEDKDNGVNSNTPSPVYRSSNTPFGIAASLCIFNNVRRPLERLHSLVVDDKVRYLDTFGEKGIDCGGIPIRADAEVLSMMKLVRSEGRTSALGGFSEYAISTEAIEMKKGLLSSKSLKQVLPKQLCAMYEESKEQWLGEVAAAWKHQVQLRPERNDFSWSNVGQMNKSFFDLCDVAQQVMVFLLGNDSPSKPEEAAFWFCFASSLHDCTLQPPLDMPPTAMSMKKLNVKLKDYTFGGTRYFKDQSAEEQQRRLLRKKRILEARKGAQEEEVVVTTNWLLNDEFDYQDEDAPVDYAAIGVVAPTENPSLAHARQARELISMKSEGHVKEEVVDDKDGGVVDAPTVLHVYPDADTAFYQKLVDATNALIVATEEDSALAKEVQRLFERCNTAQLWAKVAMLRCGMNVTDSTTATLRSVRDVFTKLAEGSPDVSATLNGKSIFGLHAVTGGVTETSLSLSQALSLAQKSISPSRLFDVVIMHHCISTGRAQEETAMHPVLRAVHDVVVPIAGLSKSALMIIESDAKDASHSLLSPLIEVPYMRAVGATVNLVAGLKEASGVVPRPVSIRASRDAPFEPNALFVGSDELKIALGGGLPVGEDGAKRVVGSSVLIADATSAHPPPKSLTYLSTVQFKRSPLQSVCHIVTTAKEGDEPPLMSTQ